MESTRTGQTLIEVKEADILIFSNLLEDNLDTMQVHLLRDRVYDNVKILAHCLTGNIYFQEQVDRQPHRQIVYATAVL